MTTPGTMAPVAGAANAPSKNSPHLHSVASSLRSCLDGMLPDSLRNDSAAFQQHLAQQRTRLQTEKNSWRFGLNYLFETLKQHKDWYARNQQFVQLRKDVKRFESHVATVRTILAESGSKLDLEAGLRGAELEGRVGAYKVMFEVTKIVSRLSRPLVKLQILKPNESSLSVYCDTFVLDIALSGGEGAVESASLTTVEKDQTSQFPDRDEDLLKSLTLLANGDSTNFTEKLNRLINRAELAVKFTAMNFEQLELELYTKATEACSQQVGGVCKQQLLRLAGVLSNKPLTNIPASSVLQKYWTAKRTVEGVRIMFKDPYACIPVIEPPRKRVKLDETQASASAGGGASGSTSGAADAVAMDGSNGTADDPDDPNNASSSAHADVLSPLANGEWAGSISFIEWRGEVALHIVGETPLVMVGQQARKLALVAMHKHSEMAATAPKDVHEDEKLFNEFVSWTTPDGKKPILPRLHFARDRSMCSVFPSRSSLAMRQEYTLTTKEISGGLKLHSFPVPLANASMETLTNVLQVCGRSLFFHALLLSAFCSRSNTFGLRIPADNEDAVNARIKVDVAAPERITMNTGELLGPDKQVLIEVNTKPDCSLELIVKYQSEATPSLTLENAVTLQKLADACHSIPLLTYYVLKRTVQAKNGPSSTGTAGANGEDCNGIAALDGDMSVSMKMEGEGMLLDEMDMF
ncbi:hypothetical protein PHYPSEUDO_001244 [Phytophthora pseudosyringae]|uniref:Mediator of RNA polymerase II transcription subunit 1 n=1 Tax=Phytophthora pseudosyringae TaxID=221518 RepID=A0A8T1VVU0_9STRA|nr:hypothetical protein PHYPSEUDO_001244 [Phytophthora pseudosyringae]